MVTAFPSVGTTISVRRSASQLAVALGGLVFAGGSISLQEMEDHGELHQLMVCLLVLIDGRCFNKRVASHQASTPCKICHSNGQRYSEPLMAL